MVLARKDVKDKSLNEALGRALKDDGRLSHPEVVDLIRSTLDHGAITLREQTELRLILTKSTTMPPRSRALLRNLLDQVALAVGTGPTRFALPEAAGNAVCDFLQRTTPGQFPGLDRDEVGVGLLMRLSRPGLIDQGGSSLCGPASLLFTLATDRPTEYATFGTDLFDKGRATIGKLTIKPGSDCRNYRPPAGVIHPTDWMTTASIRDSENWFFDYQSVGDEFAGITMPGALADWFEDAGYSDVRNVTNVYFTKGAATLGEVNNLYARNYRVCLFVGHQMLAPGTQAKGSTTPDHWVVLRSRIDRAGGSVRFKVFTWGDGEYQVPKQGTLPEGDFLKNFYGYVAAKP